MPAAAEFCHCYDNSLVDVSVPGMSVVQKCLHCTCDVLVNTCMLENPPVNVSVPLTPHHIPSTFVCAYSCLTAGTVNKMWDHVMFAHPHSALVMDHCLSEVELEYLQCDCQFDCDFHSFLMLSPFGFFMVNVRWLSQENQLYVGIETVDNCWLDWEVRLFCENNNVEFRKKLVAVPLNTRTYLFEFQFDTKKCSSFSDSEFIIFEGRPKLFLKARLN